MRIMSSNILGSHFPNPVSERERDTFRIYEDYKPDIIGFQEVNKGWRASNLFTMLSEDYIFAGTEVYNSENNVPIAIKKDYELLAKGYELLENKHDGSKAITWAVIKHKNEGTVVGVCNTHFWFKYNSKDDDVLRARNARQLCDIMKYLSNRFNCPVFAFGDMNCTRDSEVFQIVYAANDIKALYDMTENKDDMASYHGYPEKGEDGKFHGKKTDEPYANSIDHFVGYGDGYKVLQYRVMCDQYALDATDHSPIYVDIEF